MRLAKHHVSGDCVTSYRLIIGSKEARDAGMLNVDGTSKPVKKIIDAKNRRIIITLDTEEKT